MTSSPLNDIAQDAMNKGLLGEAERLYLARLVEIVWNRKSYYAIVPVYHGLAALYVAKGRRPMAIRLLQEITRIHEQEWGAQHPILALSFIELAVMCRQNSDDYLSNCFYRKGVLMLWNRMSALVQPLLNRSNPAPMLPGLEYAERTSKRSPAQFNQNWSESRILLGASIARIEAETAQGSRPFNFLAPCIEDGSADQCVCELISLFYILLDELRQETYLKPFSSEETNLIEDGIQRIIRTLKLRSNHEQDSSERVA